MTGKIIGIDLTSDGLYKLYMKVIDALVSAIREKKILGQYSAYFEVV